ncbi:Ecdysteroid kinase [Enhydrobacter aerosaccus]|uniref:Ecdysteroid kinase n=1 Tax=Enhydrobacter aerosaccus TaxID=225324 RepID=A0A1T4SW04_9HYPH|nr:phosphotransferase [Enhydrobacter aerosaccus]SKA32091.1 Ecdysteroid kinase [Enhydrobacter aerosaccus]
MGDWPRSSAAVTVEWLDAVMHRNEVLSEARVTSVTASTLGMGVGVMAEVSRLTIAYDKPEDGAPGTIISKFPTTDPANLGIARSLYFYPREVAFYTKLAQYSPVRTPRLFHAELDMADHSFVLLLEDIRNAVLGDQVAGLTPAQADAAVTAIGRLHGAWWGKVDSGDMDTLFDFSNPHYGAAVQSAYQDFLAPAFDNFPDCYSSYTRQTAEQLGAVAARVILEQSSGARSFLHGDYRADNLLFGPAFGADGIAAIDWQVSGRGGPLYDVAYLLCNSLPTSDRHQSEKALLRRYHSTLTQMGVTGFSFDDCWDAYRLAVLCGLFVAIFGTGGMDLGNQRGREMAHVMARRIDAAVSELKVGDLLPG